MPDDANLGSDLGGHAREMFRVVGTLAIDCLFLVAVALLNWLAARAITQFDLEDVDLVVFTCLQWILAASTIGLVLIRVLADLIVAVRRTWKRARRG